jgi:hypothetical protein
MVKAVLLILVTLLMGGCATGYNHEGFSGGFSETQLDENMFIVSFRGNGYSSSERVSDFTLLRSAELTLQNGYQYFVIINHEKGASKSYYTTDTKYTTHTNVRGYGNYASATSTTTASGGDTYEIVKPNATNTIVCFEKKPEGVISYNASYIYLSIKEKYGMVERESQKREYNEEKRQVSPSTEEDDLPSEDHTVIKFIGGTVAVFLLFFIISDSTL